MIQSHKALFRQKSIQILIGLLMMFNIDIASAATYISIQVPDYIALGNRIWVDRQFGGQISDNIELTEGHHDIELFGPPDQPPWLLEGYYVLRIDVNVTSCHQLTVQSAWFETYYKGSKMRSEQLPFPVIWKDGYGYRLEIQSSILPSNLSYKPESTTSLAQFSDIGVLMLITSSTPTGAEVWVDGVCIGKTASTITVPYRNKKQIGVVIRIPGNINCRWTLQSPFKSEVSLNCSRKTP